MRTAVLGGVACALGGLAASAAFGQGLPVPTPTVSVPTVSVPSVTVPPVTVAPPSAPTSPAPAPRPPVSTPTVTTPPVQTPPVSVGAPGSGGTAGVAVGSSGGSSSGGGTTAAGGSSGSAASSSSSGSAGGGGSGSSGGSSASGSSAAGAAGAAAAPRGRSTRPWIALRGSKVRRSAQLVFKLRRRGVVHVVVRQVSPMCRVAARFTVGGHAGVNRVRIGDGMHGAQLAPGTYRITGRTRSGRLVLNVTVVVVAATAPTSGELDAARRSNVCGSTGVLGSSTARASLAFAVAAGRPAHGKAELATSRSTIVRHQRAAGRPMTSGPSGAHLGHVIAADVSAAAKQAANPIVIALLALAVFIFGVAALPRAVIADPRLTAAVVSHRSTLALAGTGALVAAVVAMLLA